MIIGKVSVKNHCQSYRWIKLNKHLYSWFSCDVVIFQLGTEHDYVDVSTVMLKITNYH